MQFLSAASAWFAAALPVIILMYILKKKYTDTLVPSHLLWNRLLREQEANRPWQRLRSRWLLLLQLLAALMLVLALMQPVTFGPADSTSHAVLLIDRSGSMSATSDNGENTATTRLERALALAADWLEDQPDNRPVSLVVTGAEPEALATRERNHRLVHEKLEDIVQFYGRSDNAAALSFADSLHGGEANGTTYLVTDGEWIDAEEASSLTLSSPIEQWEASPGERKDAFENGSILSLGLREDSSSPGYQFATVTVRNDSLRSRMYGVDLYAYQSNGEEMFRTAMTIETESGDWQSADSERLPPADYYKAVLRGEPDRIAADNVAYQFPQGAKTGRALLVTDGNLFLEKALALAGVQIVKSSPEQPVPEEGMARGLDFVVVDGNIERLQAASGWSELLQKMPVWFIDHPGEDDPRTLVPTSTDVKTADHPVTAYITLQDTHIGRMFEPDETQVAWGEPILRYGGQPAIYAGTQQGRPQLRFTFNLQDTDLPLRPEFPILIVQASEWMSGSALPHLGTAVAGSEMQVALQSDTVQAEWSKADGGGLSDREQQGATLPPPASLSGENFLLPSMPGLYRLEERNGEGEITASRLLVVTPDMAELEWLDWDGEQRPALDIGYASQTDDSERSGSDRGGETPYSLIGWAAALLLALVVAEWEVYRRGHIG